MIKEDKTMAMEISNAYSSYANTYANGAGSKKAASESRTVAKTDKTDTSAAARTATSDYLTELQKKNPKLNLLTGYSNGSAGSSNYPEKIDVTIAPGFLEKMASDPKLAAEYEKNLADIPSACKWGESMIHAMTGDTVYEFRFYIDENGNMSAGSVSGPGKKREIFERSRQRAKQQKEDYAKRIEERIKSNAEKKEKTEKETLHTHEVRIAGNDVQSLTEKLVEANTPSKNSTVSGTTGVDIKI